MGMLGIVNQDAEDKAEQISDFMADVENVEFSAPEFMSVSRVEEDTTVGEIKDRLGLVCENSALLKEEALEAINASEIKAGDWALISVVPFETEENLIVTLKDDEEFSIRVTDAQLRKTVISADGNAYEITVTYFGTAQIPDGAELKVREILEDDEDYTEYYKKTIAKTEELNIDDFSENTSDEGAKDPAEVPEGVKDEETYVEDSEEKESTWTSRNTFAAAAVKPEIDKIFDYVRFFDIRIWAEGREVEPQSDVSVAISLADVPEDMSSDLQVVHFGKGGTELLNAEEHWKIEEDAAVTELSFTTDGFSVYTVASTANNLGENIFLRDYVLVNHGVAVSPEQNTTSGYTQNRRGIPVTVANGRISTDEDTLPVWRLGRDWDNRQNKWRYYVSTIYEDKTQYLHIANNNSGATNISTEKQYLRIETRNNGTEYRFYREHSGQSLDLFDNNYQHGFGTYDGNREYEYFTLYELGEEIRNKVTVHFVDRDGNPLTGVTYSGDYGDYVVNNEDGTFEIPYNWKSPNEAVVNLKTDFAKSGYTYSSSHLAGIRTGEAELKWGGLTIDEKLHSTGHALEYYTDRGRNSPPDINTQYPYTNDVGNVGYFPPRVFNFNDQLKVYKSDNSEVVYTQAGVDKDVYVILDPVTSGNGSGNNSGSGSGSSGSGSGGGSHDAEDPNFHKQLTPNQDGTYTLSLSVTGHAKNTTEQPKANILLVVDTSSSMNGSTTDLNGNSSTRLNATKGELKTLGGLLLDKNTTEHPDSVELAMISFDGDVVNELDWVKAKNEFSSCVDSSSHLKMHRGTDWEDALQKALEIADDKKEKEPDQPVFIVFFTDGEPSQYSNFHGTGDFNGSGGNYQHYYSYYLSRETTKDEMRAIVLSGHRLYGVYAFNDYDNANDNRHPTHPYNEEKGHDLLHHAIQYGYNTNADLSGSYFHYARNGSELNNAFSAILKAINETVGFDEVVMTDSITSLTSVGISMDGEEAVGFKYTRSGGQYGANGETWTTAPKATYTEAHDGELAKVTWDLSSCGMLEDGVTYTVSFTVWPSQDAYDYVTKLNNRFIESIDDIPEPDRSCFTYNQKTGRYEVMTNPESGPTQDGSVTNRIDYHKEKTETVNELPPGVTPGVNIR